MDEGGRKTEREGGRQGGKKGGLGELGMVMERGEGRE